MTPIAQWTLESSALYRQSRADIDAPGLLPTGQIGLVDHIDAFAREESWVAQTAAHGRLLAGWQSSLQLGFTRNRASLAAFNQQAGFDQRLLLARWTNTHDIYRATPERGTDLGAPDLDLIWGAEVHQQEGENLFDLPGRPLHDSRTLIAGLLELQGHSEPWAGFLGTSLDHYDDFGAHPTLYAGVSRWMTPGGRSTSNRAGIPTLYAGVSRWMTPTLKLRASGGRGYRPPAFQELYFVPFFGNPSLVPEQGWSGDLGLDWEPGTGTRVSIAGYYQRYDDLIQLTLAPTLSSLAQAMPPISMHKRAIRSRLPSRFISAAKTSATIVRPRSSVSAPAAPRSTPGCGCTYDKGRNPAVRSGLSVFRLARASLMTPPRVTRQ